MYKSVKVENIIIQFCSPRSKSIDFIFNMNETEIELVQQYKYLGMVLDAHLKFDACDSVFSKAL